MTLPDKLFVVKLAHFTPQCDDNTRVGTLRAAEADCHWLNQGSRPVFLGVTLEDATNRAAREEVPRLRAPGYVSAQVVWAEFNPPTDSIPTPHMTSGRRILLGERE